MNFAKLKRVSRIIAKPQQGRIIVLGNAANASQLELDSGQSRRPGASKSAFEAEMICIDSSHDCLYAISQIMKQLLDRENSAYLRNDLPGVLSAISSGPGSEKRIAPYLLGIRECVKENSINISFSPEDCTYVAHLAKWVPDDPVEYVRYLFSYNVLTLADTGAMSAYRLRSRQERSA